MYVDAELMVELIAEEELSAAFSAAGTGALLRHNQPCAGQWLSRTGFWCLHTRHQQKAVRHQTYAQAAAPVQDTVIYPAPADAVFAAVLCCFVNHPLCTGERRSRRARKNRQPIKACSTDTLAMLRLKVFQALSIHPQNQRLYVRGELLSGEQDTLAKVREWREVAEGCRGYSPHACQQLLEAS